MVEETIAALRQSKPVPDTIFDAQYPPWVRALSGMHWTPVSVAIDAVRLFRPRAGMRILDIGCGPGKLCTIGSLCSRATFVGVEQRRNLVQVARKVSVRHRLNATYLHDDAASISWTDFEGLYFFNPFGEQLFGDSNPYVIDEEFPPSELRYQQIVKLAEKRLAEAKTGTRVVTYMGFGGKMPRSFHRSARREADGGFLELWIKQS